MIDRQNPHRLSAKPAHRKNSAEPDLVMLLSDPEVRLLMQADNVDEAELRSLLRSVSKHLQSLEKEQGDRVYRGYFRHGL